MSCARQVTLKAFSARLTAPLSQTCCITSTAPAPALNAPQSLHLRALDGGPRRSLLRRGPPSRVGGKLAIASSGQPRRENSGAEFSSVRVGTPLAINWIPGFCGVDYPDSRIFRACCSVPIQFPNFPECRYADYPDSRIFQACRPVPIQIIRYPDYPIASKKYIGSRSGDIA